MRAKIREVVKDPEDGRGADAEATSSAASGCASTPATGKPSTGRNVTLVDISDEPIERITANGLRAKGQDYTFDCLVLATGFDAMTGALLKVDIRGRGGVALKDKWSEGPKSYLGLTVVGFPNLFTITGPGSPSVLTNMLPSIEQHVDLIADCLEYAARQGRERDRAGRRGPGSLGRPCRRRRQHHAALDLQLLVRRRQHPRQAARVHALYRRPAGLHRSAARRW